VKFGRIEKSLTPGIYISKPLRKPRRQRNITMDLRIGRLVNLSVILLVFNLRAPRSDSVWLKLFCGWETLFLTQRMKYISNA
jgi:hypothetical protein